MKLTDSERATLASRLLLSFPPEFEDDNDGFREVLRRKAEMEADPSIGSAFTNGPRRISPGTHLAGILKTAAIPEQVACHGESTCFC